ncbi:MFS transporter [Patescibacteria group bacterium]|nr:MFS transporter [Patescibacteria group bacterium]MBU1519613.1 MFS transporter [Patescibacteria group bacterium]MBU2010388.1 MFS transporter [Patescibacteria group bacterium]MBU2461145.1 MFS transporter [Patescibacteria group bacterium]
MGINLEKIKRISKPKHKLILVIYAMVFLTAFHTAASLYVESSFMNSTVEQLSTNKIGTLVGLVYATASLITLITLIHISKILRRVGNFRMAVFVVFIEILSLFGLVLAQSPIFLMLVFIVHLIVSSLFIFNLDLFLESSSQDKETGTLRGTFLTSFSVAFVLAPFIAGLLLTNGDFWKLFFVSALVMIPVLLLLYTQFRNHKDPVYDNVPFLKTLKEIKRRKNIYKIMVSSFLLKFFYSWMVIYVPIYLYQEMGIPMSQILGVIIPIMLLPFVFLGIPLGKLADTVLGEKEILTIGFIIMGVSTMSLAYITSANLAIWIFLLFLTRIGASCVDTMSETYFYKKIDATDTHLIGCFKTLIPLAYLLGPLVATGFLGFFEYKFLFIVLGIIMLTGTRHSLTLEDTL